MDEEKLMMNRYSNSSVLRGDVKGFLSFGFCTSGSCCVKMVETILKAVIIEKIILNTQAIM